MLVTRWLTHAEFEKCKGLLAIVALYPNNIRSGTTTVQLSTCAHLLGRHRAML